MTDRRDFRSLEDYRQWLRLYRLFRDYPMNEIRRGGLEQLPRIRENVRGTCREDLDMWEQLILHASDEDLKSVALDTGFHGVSMRQDNPFIGIMSEADRLAVIRDSANEERSIRALAQSH